MMKSTVGICVLLSAIATLQASPAIFYRGGYGPGDQEYGYVDVRPGAHMFFWLFYVQNPKVTSYYDRPLVIWLQGGPGGSSTSFGNFEEIGPLFVNGTARPSSWAKHVNLLFIDNPVGTGYSYVDSLSYLTKTNAEIGRDMVTFLRSFYQKFPKFQKTPLYIYCESYGGKMTAEISVQLLDAIKKGLNINFKGVGLGDSWISPMDSVNTWAPFLYYTGMVDTEGFGRLQTEAKQVQYAVDRGLWRKATELWRSFEYSVMKETAGADFYNIMYKVNASVYENAMARGDRPTLRFGTVELQKLMNGPVKKALGVPAQVSHGSQSSAVFEALSEDFMKPVIHVVENLLNNTELQVVVFTGNLDLIVDTPGTILWMDNMRWKNAAAFKKAPRKPLIVKGYVEGFVKNYGNLYLYWVHRAGHMVPTDNPETALEILRRATGFDKRETDAVEDGGLEPNML